MIPIRAAYDQLPESTRRLIRSILPEGILRWYANKNTDVYLFSYPKCGRTWLRLMIGRILIKHFELPDDEEILILRWKKSPHPNIPKISVVHEDRPMLKSPDMLEKSKIHYQNKKVIFLVRDPRDVIVSNYFEQSKRITIFGTSGHQTQPTTFDGNLSAFINQEIGGFDTILTYYNIWAANRNVPKGFHLVRYEDMKSDTHRVLRKILDFLELCNISDETIDEAVSFASFENMRRMEIGGEFKARMMKPADTTDNESYKTRRGEVGGYNNYLSHAEIRSLSDKIRNNLDEYFGYKA